MTTSKQVHFDPATGRVIQWRDYEKFGYADVPADELRDVSDAEWEAHAGQDTMVADGQLVPYAAPQPVLSADEIEAQKVKAAESAIQSHLDAKARERGYDGILSAATYAALPAGAPFQSEGAAFALWRAQCWAAAYAVLADVKAGTRAEPDHDALIAELPALVLP